MDPLNEVDEDQPNKRRRLCSSNNGTDGKSNAFADDNTNDHVPIRTVYVYVGGAGKDVRHHYNNYYRLISSIS